MLVGIVPPLIAACEARGARITHLVCMMDSIATRAAVNHDSLPSPQLNFLITDLTDSLRAALHRSLARQCRSSWQCTCLGCGT